MHLLQRIYGTMVQAAPDRARPGPWSTRPRRRSERDDACSFCLVTLAVPAAIACARAGDLKLGLAPALVIAERSAAKWPDTAWAAAAQEARAHIAWAEGDPAESERLLSAAAAGFRAAGQPSDVAPARRYARRSSPGLVTH